MSRRITLEITATGARVVGQETKRAGRHVDQLGQRASKVGSKLRSMYGAIGGLGVLAGAKRVLDFDKALGKLQGKMGASTPEMFALRKEVLETSTAFGLAKEDVIAALMVFQDVGGSVAEGRTQLAELAKVAKATSTPIEQLASVAATLIDAGFMPEDAVRSVALLSAQADQATVSMEGISRVIAEVVKGAGAFGERFKGNEGVKQIGTIMQVAGAAFAGNAEKTNTAVRAMMSDMVGKAKELRKLGVNPVDEKGLRDVLDIVRDIDKATGGDIEKLSKVFGRESLAAMAAVMEALRAQKAGAKPGQKSPLLDRLGGITGGTIDKQFNLRMEGIAKQAEEVEHALRYLDAELMRAGGSAIKWLADDFPRNASALLSGVVALKMAGPMASAMAPALGSLGGLGRVAGMAAANMGPLVGALAAGYALGTAFDNLTGWSDRLSNYFWEILNPAAAARRKAQQTGTAEERVKAALQNVESEFGTPVGSVASRPAHERGGARPVATPSQYLLVTMQNKTGVDGIKVSGGKGAKQ